MRKWKAAVVDHYDRHFKLELAAVEKRETRPYRVLTPL